MNIKEFHRKYMVQYTNVGMKEDGTMEAHDLPTAVRVYDEEGNEYEIEGVEGRYLMGCMCQDEIIIHVKRIHDE